MAKKFLSLDEGHFEIAYEILNHNSEETLVFLHGWGSNKELMKQAFSPYFRDFNHLYIDLPGFGQSQNATILNTQKYAKIIRLFLESLKLDNGVIVGHSFGGKVATLLAPKELVLLSSAGIVCDKPLKIKLKIMLAKILKKLKINSNLLRSNDAYGLNEAMYQTFKNVVDEDFSQVFASSSSQAYILWGNQDKATPLSSGEKICSLFQKSKFRSFDGDHYFFLSHAKEIEEQILKWREELE